MRLFLSDTFVTKLLQLPKGTQQKVLSFHRKFRSDSTSSGIHLEPLHASNLLSARVDGAYRVIIGRIEGETYNLLYVDKHDDAYEWASRRRFAWNKHLQTCQLIPVIESASSDAEQQHQEPEPSSTQTSYFSNISNEQLLKIGVPAELISKVRSLKDLNDLDKVEKLLPQEAFENLFALFDDGDINEIIASIEEGLAGAGKDELLSNNNQRHFIELTDDETLQEILEKDMETWQLFLHPSQRKLVDARYKGTVKVSGSAGTGKTIAAIHRLKYLCNTPYTKVLFTTYTNTLRVHLEPLINKLEIPRERYVLNNIDKVLSEIVTRYGLMPFGYEVLDYQGNDKSQQLWRELLEAENIDFDEKFLYDEYIQVIVYNNIHDMKAYMRQARTGRTKAISRKQRLQVWQLVEKYETMKQERKVVDRLELFNIAANYLKEHEEHPYTNVIADEFQDFSNPELRFLRALVAEGENDLFLTGDPFQRIYTGQKIKFSAVGINVRGNRSRNPKVNYRTTEEIKKAAVAVVKGIKYDDMDGGEEKLNGYVSLIHGNRPVYEFVNNGNEEVDRVVGWINECLEGGIQEQEICVAARSMNFMKAFQGTLHREGMKYQNIKASGKAEGDKDGISLCTFHSLKGLEFRVIILMGVNERNVPSKATADYPFINMDVVEQKEYLASIRSLLYVAITRARQLVFIVGYGQPCQLLNSI